MWPSGNISADQHTGTLSFCIDHVLQVRMVSGINVPNFHWLMKAKGGLPGSPSFFTTCLGKQMVITQIVYKSPSPATALSRKRHCWFGVFWPVQCPGKSSGGGNSTYRAAMWPGDEKRSLHSSSGCAAKSMGHQEEHGWFQRRVQQCMFLLCQSSSEY